MSIIQFLRILLARWKMILATLLGCMIVASSVAMMLPKRYPATARVLLDLKSDPVTGEAINARGSGYLGTQTQIIRDMRVAGSVVDRLGLLNDPGLIAAYEASGRSSTDGGMRAWLGQQIIDTTSSGLISGSNILEIRFESSTPERAKQIVGVIREAYISESLRLRTDSAGRTGSWYREQTEKARIELSEAEARMSAYMTEHSIIMVNGMDSESAKLNSLQAALQQAQGMESSNAVTTSQRLANDPVADQLQIQLSQIEDELALANARLGAEHPSYKAILARRNTLAKQVGQARSKSASGVSAVTGAARQSVAALEGQVEAQAKLVLGRKPVLDELVRLSREVELKRQQYENASARTDQLNLQADQSEPGIVIMGDPTVSRTPSYPKIPIIIMLSAVFGLGLGLVAAVIAELIARRVRGHEDLAFAAGAPVLVVIGQTAPSPLRYRLQKLLGRRRLGESDGAVQAI